MDGWEPQWVVGNLKVLNIYWLRGYAVTRLRGYAYGIVCSIIPEEGWYEVTLPFPFSFFSSSTIIDLHLVFDAFQLFKLFKCFLSLRLNNFV